MESWEFHCPLFLAGVSAMEMEICAPPRLQHVIQVRSNKRTRADARLRRCTTNWRTNGLPKGHRGGSILEPWEGANLLADALLPIITQSAVFSAGRKALSLPLSATLSLVVIEIKNAFVTSLNHLSSICSFGISVFLSSPCDTTPKRIVIFLGDDST